MTILTGAERGKLCTALEAAFPKRADFERVVSFSLNKSLDVLADPGDLRSIIFQVVIEAEAQELLPELLRAARTQNSTNTTLRQVVESLQYHWKSQSTPTPLSSLVVDLRVYKQHEKLIVVLNDFLHHANLGLLRSDPQGLDSVPRAMQAIIKDLSRLYTDGSIDSLDMDTVLDRIIAALQSLYTALALIPHQDSRIKIKFYEHVLASAAKMTDALHTLQIIPAAGAQSSVPKSSDHQSASRVRSSAPPSSGSTATAKRRSRQRTPAP